MQDKNGKAPRVAVVGVGNTLMGDDGVGILIMEKLQSSVASPNVEVIASPTADLGLIKFFRGYDLTIVVDALHVEGAKPGDIFRFNPDEAGVTDLRSNNIHGMGVSYLVTCARMLGADPNVIVYGIQVEDVRQNDYTLTRPVAKSAARVQELIVEELQKLGALNGKAAGK